MNEVKTAYYVHFVGTLDGQVNVRHEARFATEEAARAYCARFALPTRIRAVTTRGYAHVATAWLEEASL